MANSILVADSNLAVNVVILTADLAVVSKNNNYYDADSALCDAT